MLDLVFQKINITLDNISLLLSGGDKIYCALYPHGALQFQCMNNLAQMFPDNFHINTGTLILLFIVSLCQFK